MTRLFFFAWLFFLNFYNIGLHAQSVIEWVGPSNGTWNTVVNWSPATSINGRRLEFKGLGLSPSVNDTNFNFSGLIFSGPSGYTINGNTINLVDNSIGSFGRLVNMSNGNQTINATIEFADFNKNGIIYDSASGGIILKKLILGSNLAGLLIYGENATKLISIEDSIFGSKRVIIGLSDSGFLKPNTRVRFKGFNAAYSGDITLQGGGLHLEKALGINSKLEVKSGAMLTISWGKDVKGMPIYINGEGINLGGALVSRGITDTILNDIVFNSSSRIAVSKGASGSLVLSKILTTSNASANILFDSATNNDNAQFGNITVTDTIGSPSLPFLNLSKEANSTLTIMKKCYYDGYTRISKGRLQLGDNNVLPFTTTIDLYKDDCIFSTGATIGYSQTFASLAIFAQNHNPTINLGTGVHTITFGSSRDQLWWQNIPSNAHIKITGWKGIPGAGGTEGRIFFNSVSGTPGLTQWQLDRIRWIDIPSGNTTIGAMLLPSGELVPSTLPIITSLTTDIPSTSKPANSGYIGTTVTLTGHRFLSVVKLLIGGVEVPRLLPLSASNLKFKVDINTSGDILLITSTDTLIYTSPFVNLGYVTRMRNRSWSDLSSPGTWLEPGVVTTEIVPTANKSVTIGDSSISINSFAALINSTTLDSNTLTIKSGLAAGAGRNNASLQLAGDQLIDIKTHVVFDSGQLRMYNGESRINASLLNGLNQEFNTLKLIRNTSISLGKNSHILKFAPSNLVNWNDSATVNLTIFNWEGVNETSGTAGKIFFGDKDTTLTAQQLLQIRFAGRCGPATLLPDGELVPSNDPYFSSVTSDVGAGAFTGYIGSTVTIAGCQLSDVIKVKIGLWEGAVFDKSANSLKFIVDKDIQNDFIELITSGGDTGKSRIVFRNLGYTNKISGDWETGTTWVGDASPTSGKKVTIRNGNTIVISSVLTAITDSLVLTDANSVLQLKGDGKLVVDKALIINNTSRIEMTDNDNSILEMNGPGFFTNLSLLNSFTKGTVVFNNKISMVNSTRAFTFNNLTLNGDTLTLSPNGGRLPTINGELTINGGTIFQSGQNGPLYGAVSKLIYASGESINRGLEWNANGVLTTNQRGLPRKVVVENGTVLNLAPLSIGSENLLLNGDLEIRKGKVINSLGAPLSVIGDLYIGNENSSFSELELLNGPLFLQGDFSKHLNSSFTSSSQKVLLTGNRSVYINANSHPDSSDPSNIGFDFLSINKNGFITLNSSIHVNDSIDFGLGIILSKSSHFLQVGNNATSSGGNISSFVDGPMKKQTSLGSNDFEFKIGKIFPNTVYKPIWIADLLPNGTTTFSAEYFPTSTTTMPTFSGSIFVDPILTGIWANEWWNIERTGTGKARVGIYYLPIADSFWEPTAPCSECYVGVVHYNSTPSSWEFTKTSGTFNIASPPYFEAALNATSGLVYSDVETSFSPFTIGFTLPSVLPIKLTNFSAELQNGDGLINWHVTDVNTVKHFELEYSTDGIRFQTLSTITPAENNAFQYLDKNLTTGIHYYRLKMIEKNGRYTYSRIEWIQVDTDKSIISGLMQNPVGGGQAIVKLYSASSQTAEAIVVDRSGRVILSQRLTLQKGNNQVNISVLPLNSGTYFLKLRTKDGVEKVMPFLK